MTGAEYLTADVLAALWLSMNAQLTAELALSARAWIGCFLQTPPCAAGSSSLVTSMPAAIASDASEKLRPARSINLSRTWPKPMVERVD
jgi:hypothetical protein